MHGGSNGELNLIPLIDIMSVLVSFLLIYSAEVDVVSNAKGVEIPSSSAEAQPNPSLVVTLSKEEILVQGEVVATIAQVLNNDNITVIEPLREVLERPTLITDAASIDPSQREITVVADKSLPFDVVKKVMATCTASSYGKISLAVMEGGKVGGVGK